jgi:hypothetical protein
LFTALMAGLANGDRGAARAARSCSPAGEYPEDELPQPVTGIAFYDDLEPDCLTGGIDFHARRVHRAAGPFSGARGAG